MHISHTFSNRKVLGTRKSETKNDGNSHYFLYIYNWNVIILCPAKTFTIFDGPHSNFHFCVYATYQKSGTVWQNFNRCDENRDGAIRDWNHITAQYSRTTLNKLYPKFGETDVVRQGKNASPASLYIIDNTKRTRGQKYRRFIYAGTDTDRDIWYPWTTIRRSFPYLPTFWLANSSRYGATQWHENLLLARFLGVIIFTSVTLFFPFRWMRIFFERRMFTIAPLTFTYTSVFVVHVVWQYNITLWTISRGHGELCFCENNFVVVCEQKA